MERILKMSKEKNLPDLPKTFLGNIKPETKKQYYDYEMPRYRR